MCVGRPCPLKKRAAIQRLLESYHAPLAVSESLDGLVGKSLKDLSQSSDTFNLELPDSPFLSGIGEWRVATLVAPGGATGSAVEASSTGDLLWQGDDDAAGAASESPEVILMKGLHEITSLLGTDYAVDDVFSVAIETIDRALGVASVRVSSS